MKEPIWESQPKSYLRDVRKNDIVWVHKKTRGRFGKMDVANVGDHGIVISSWTSSMGTPKIGILTDDLREFATTASCARVFGTLADESSHDIWYPIKLAWMAKTYVPMIVVKEETAKGRKGSAYVMTRDGNAVLIKPLGSEVKMWLSQDKCHPDDWSGLVESVEKCHSIRVPGWVAKKGGLYNNGGG